MRYELFHPWKGLISQIFTRYMTVYSFYHDSCIFIVIRALLEINENCSVRLDTSSLKL